MDIKLLQEASRAVFQDDTYSDLTKGKVVGGVQCDISKAGPFTIAKAQYLNKDEVSHFIAGCKEQKMIPIFNSYEKHPYNNYQTSTVIMDLTEELDTQIKSNQRRHARKCSRDGVTVEISDSREDWESYKEILKELYARKKEVADTFNDEAYWRQFESGLVQLFVARFEGKVIGGGLFFMNKPFVYYYSGAVDPEHYNLHPMSLILYTVAEHCKNSEYKVFDLGGYADAGDGERARIDRFKKDYGTIVECYDWYPVKRFYYLKKLKDFRFF